MWMDPLPMKPRSSMDQLTEKEKILKKIRDALSDLPDLVGSKIDLESSVYLQKDDNPDVVFAEEFVAKGGMFVYCENLDVALENIYSLVHEQSWNGKIFCADDIVSKLLTTCNIDFTKAAQEAPFRPVVFSGCRYLVSQGGSVVFDCLGTGRKSFFHAQSVVFVATVSQIIPDLHTAMHLVKNNTSRDASSVYIWTGDSEICDFTGDVTPGYGPVRTFVILIDNVEI